MKDAFKVSRLDVPSPSSFSQVGYQNYGNKKLRNASLTVDVVAAQNHSLIPSPNGTPSPTARTKRVGSPSTGRRIHSPQPQNEQLDWQHLIGGHYNSPRCVNTDHRDRNSPHFLRKSQIEPAGQKTVLLDEPALESPILLERRANQLLYSPKSPKSVLTPNSPKSSPKQLQLSPKFKKQVEVNQMEQLPTSESPKEKPEQQTENSDYVDHYAAFESDKQQVPTSTVNIALTPRLNKLEEFSAGLPRLRPKTTKSSKRPSAITPAEQKETIETAFHNFDRQYMEYVSTDFELEELPDDLVPTVEAMQRKKNMLRNNYQKFYPRGVKGLTAYRHYTSYKLARDEIDHRQQEQQKSMEVLQHKMNNQLLVENKKRKSANG